VEGFEIARWPRPRRASWPWAASGRITELEKLRPRPRTHTWDRKTQNAALRRLTLRRCPSFHCATHACKTQVVGALPGFASSFNCQGSPRALSCETTWSATAYRSSSVNKNVLTMISAYEHGQNAARWRQIAEMSSRAEIAEFARWISQRGSCVSSQASAPGSGAIGRASSRLRACIQTRTGPLVEYSSALFKAFPGASTPPATKTLLSCIAIGRIRKSVSV
jgi:hypothetical protein